MSRFERIELPQDAARKRAGRAAVATVEDRYRMLGPSHWLREAHRERRSGNFENALRNYSRALEFDRLAIDGWRGQVQVLVLLDECPEAELWSRKALELLPQDGDLLAGRAQALCRLGQIRLAHELSDVSLGRMGESAYRWMVRGEILLAGGESAADHCFRRALVVDHDWLAGVEIAHICRHYTMPAKALTFVHGSLQTAADQTFPWYILGQCQLELEMTAAARRSFERCLELTPRHAAAQSALAELSNRSFSLARWLRRYW